jgi:hypothetical protein
VIDLIEKLSNAGGFEDTLAYVNLPTLSIPPDESGRRSAHSKEDTRQQRGDALGRNALVKVFDKLAAVNVRRILRLHVDDADEVPHTDAAIERAIRGCDSCSPGEAKRQAIVVELWYVDFGLSSRRLPRQ